MQITHEEARQLIHFNTDEALNPQEKTVLSTHINICFECRVYAEEIQEVERILLPMMKKHWNRRPMPLSISDLRVKRVAKPSSSNMILAMRTALIGFVFVALVFTAWQFTFSGQQLPGLSPVIVASVPTPSIESTNTTINPKSCDVIQYRVQANDTLASIAYQFSISKDEIVSINRLRTETVNTGMTLKIPACRFTPTGTMWPTITTTTFTPLISSATSSPEPNRY